MPLPNQKALEQGNPLVTLGPRLDRFLSFLCNTEIAGQSINGAILCKHSDTQTDARSLS